MAGSVPCSWLDDCLHELIVDHRPEKLLQTPGSSSKMNLGRVGAVSYQSLYSATHLWPPSVLVKGLENKHIVAIASGHQHSLAMDKEGYVWSWGHGGFGRLGHGEQKDCLAPRLVDAFTGDQRILRASKIACGANCSIGTLSAFPAHLMLISTAFLQWSTVKE